MKISIITPSLNQGTYIEKTIRSVIQQDYPDIEYIVMDGGSTDGTVKILQEYERRILRDTKKKAIVPYPKYKDNQGTKNQELRTFYWVSEKDRGQADAINKGLKIATGDIVGYLNSDDYFEKGALQKVVDFFRTHKNAIWVTGDYRIVDEKGQEIQTLVKRYKMVLQNLPLSFILPILNPISQPSTFWRRDVMKKVGYFDTTLRYTFDYDYWLRLIKLYPLGKIPQTLSSFRIQKNSKGNKYFNEQFAEELRVLQKYTHNPFILFLHKCHNLFVILIYRLIKNPQSIRSRLSLS